MSSGSPIGSDAVARARDGARVVVLAGARVVTPGGVLDPGWVRLDGGRIAQVGGGRAPAPAPGDALLELDGDWLLPGFVDLHVHGGGGHDLAASAVDLDAAVAFHRRHGTTRTLVSLVAAAPDDLCRQLRRVADRVAADPHVLGAHLEGPFLAPDRCGAQPAEHLRLPDPALFARLVAAARGTLKVITLAPELPGAAELAADARAEGIVVAVGHTAATFEQAAGAFAAGAGLATHLFNAMTGIGHREPGAALAALDAEAACELINDGVHLHPAVVRWVLRCAARPVLVTDAIAAAGCEPGAGGGYWLGGHPVVVAGGAARLAGTGTLAGSTLTMDAAVRRAVLDLGVPIETVAAAAATHPAAVLGLSARCGAIAPGLAADLVILDDGLVVREVVLSGEPCR